MAKKRFSIVLPLVAVSLVLLLVSGVLWWRNIYTDPQKVFKAMLGNSLRTKSFTKQVAINESGQDSSQVTYVQFGPEITALSQTKLSQTSEGLKTSVETESVGTPKADYVRYTKIETDETGANGQPIDFSNILNVWGTTDPDNSNNFTSGQLYNETVLGPVVFGLFDQSRRQALLRLIDERNIYEIDYKTVGKSSIDGRPVYSYSVSVDAVGYATLLKEFAETQGLNTYAELDPSSYAQLGKLEFILSVDVWSRQLRRVEYPSGERTENYTAYNALKEITIPSDAVSVQELELRLQQLQ